jgi:hypothetical protein
MGKRKRKADPTGAAFGAKRIVLLQIGRELKFPQVSISVCMVRRVVASEK